MNPPNLDRILQLLIGSAVESFLANRPLNTMLKHLVDRQGQVVDGPVEIMKRFNMFVEREERNRIVGCYMQIHKSEVVGSSTFLDSLLTTRDWQTAFDGHFTSANGLLITVKYSEQSGWLTIRCDEFNELLQRVCQLRAA